MPAIEVIGLTKAFRTYKKQPGSGGAVRGLFHTTYEQTAAVKTSASRLNPASWLDFWGEGAGKTTTLKMLSGLLYPTGGPAPVLGHVPWERDDGYRRQFALLLGQKNQLWWDLPARESLEPRRRSLQHLRRRPPPALAPPRLRHGQHLPGRRGYRSELAARLDAAEADVLVVGHTHIAFRLSVPGGWGSS